MLDCDTGTKDIILWNYWGFIVGLVGIMGALPEEIAHITAELQDTRTEEIAGITYTSGHYAGQQVVACCGGMGKANAASTVQVLISHFGATVVIFSGIAGNMSTKIGIGDVVIGKTLVYHDAEDRMLADSAPGTAVYTADAGLVAAAETACKQEKVRYIVGKIATGDQFVGDPAQKEGILRRCAPDCVEMEGAAVGQTCMRNNIPFVVVRAMSDNSDESIDSLGAEAFDVDAYAATAARIVLGMLTARAAAE